MPQLPRWFALCCGFLAAGAALAAAPLRVGIDLDGEPMTFVDARGVARGFSVDLMNAIAREMGFEVVYVARPWPEMMEDFKAGRTDALANITYTAERATFIEFTAPDIVMNGAIFVRHGDTAIRSTVDLRNVRVAVKPGGAPYDYLVAHGWADHVVPTATLRDSLRCVAEGRADAALDARIIGLKNIRDDRLGGLEVAPVSLLDFAQRLHIGLQKGDVARLALFNDGLARLHASGSYDRIYDRWIGPLEPGRLRFRDVEPYLPAAVGLIALIAGTLLWQRRLLRRLSRQAEALRQSEERLSLVLEGTEDGFWDCDLATGRVERSARWAAMLGYPLAAVPPTLAGARDLVHPDDLPAYDAFQAARRTGQSSRSDLEYRLRTREGGWRWILDRGKVVARAADGAPLRLAGTQTDVTELREAREQLARREAQFRFIYEHAPVGLSWVQAGRSESRLVNPAHERITGVPAARATVGANYIAASHPEDRETQRVLQERLYRGEIDSFSMEKRYVHADGTLVWALFTMHLYRDAHAGEAQEMVTLVDISSHKCAEDERESLRLKMLETQKLESLGVLAGGIAHDFNNILTIILANAGLMRLDRGKPAESARYLSLIESAAQRAAGLCRQMLAYAGKGAFLTERVDLTQLVRGTAHLLQVSINKKARLTLTLAPALPEVEADASQIQQVVMNLVINASEALADKPGEIRVTASLGRPEYGPGVVVHSFELPPGDAVCLEVADTGEGMDAPTLARIFDPFFTTKFTGRGLGLAAVLGIVRAHRGALTVQSAPGGGTTFRLYLPAAPALPALPRRAAAASPAPAQRGTILIADDEPVVLTTTALLLEHHGFATVQASDGNEAVQRFRERPAGFAAVLLDLTMPGLDGAEVLREIRTIDPAARVLVMSGYSEKDVLARLKDQGRVAILPKPFSIETFLERIGAVASAPIP